MGAALTRTDIGPLAARRGDNPEPSGLDGGSGSKSSAIEPRDVPGLELTGPGGEQLGAAYTGWRCCARSAGGEGGRDASTWRGPQDHGLNSYYLFSNLLGHNSRAFIVAESTSTSHPPSPEPTPGGRARTNEKTYPLSVLSYRIILMFAVSSTPVTREIAAFAAEALSRSGGSPLCWDLCDALGSGCCSILPQLKPTHAAPRNGIMTRSRVHTPTVLMRVGK